VKLIVTAKGSKIQKQFSIVRKEKTVESRLLTTITALCLCFSAVSLRGRQTWWPRLPTGLSGEVRNLTGYRRSAASLNNGRRADRNRSGSWTTSGTAFQGRRWSERESIWWAIAALITSLSRLFNPGWKSHLDHARL